MESYDIFGRTLTVSEANSIIHDTVEEIFYELRIEGEISGFRPASSGHWYFTLKDSSSAIDAAVFRSAQYAMEYPKNGDLVVARGSLSFYTKTGKLTYVIREMKRKGEGDLLQIIEKRKEYYRGLGYFDEDRKKPIPEEIRTLGVVTSPTGAAIRDILNITRRRAPSLDIIIFPAAVQGDGAAASIASRIRQADNFQACDLLIVGRGGGSVEDLACFSEPEVIEAIHSCSIPVISAVGHEIDWPISDFAADRRAPTPSAAAELATETIYRRRERLQSALSGADSAVKAKLAEARIRLSDALKGLYSFERKLASLSGSIPSSEDLRKLLILRMQSAQTRQDYAEEEISSDIDRKVKSGISGLRMNVDGQEEALLGRIEDARRRIDRIISTPEERIRGRILVTRTRLDSAIREAEALSPLAILGRGYSVTAKEDGTIVRSSSQLGPGDIIRTRLMDGTVLSRVEE